MGGRNRTWTRDGNSNGFNPMGNRNDRPYSRGGKGKGDRREVRVDRIVDERKTDGKGGHNDKLSMKLLNLYCEKKWNSQSGMLDLSNLKNAEDIAELNVNLNNNHFCDKLAKVISTGEAWAKSLNSINFADNNIYSLKHIAQALAFNDVRIQNLALNNNKIKDLSEVEWLLDLKLREVLFLGNPIAGLGDSYHKHVVKKLRTIELLDLVSVKDWRKELLPNLPEPRDSCMADEANASIVFQMCQMYFAAVDKADYDALLDAYDSKCCFSHTSESSNRVYRNSSAKTYHANLQLKNHNLKLAFTAKRPCNNVFQGRPAVVGFLSNDLYNKVETKHDVSKFKADAVTMGDTVVATIHGQYTYTVQGDKAEYSRCFDRVFVLKPNRVGTGWPARIANDTLTLRAIQDHPIVLPPTPSAAAPAPTPAAAMDIPAQLMQQTNLNEQFAALLLQEAGSLEAALQLFTQNQALGTIPPEAFRK